ncbi:MAG: Na/Pi cotransporter family protein [Hyphomicrobiaceae bacterium]
MTGFDLLASFVGFVALLLWGVRMVRTGITRTFTAQMRRVLATGTRNRLAAFVTGLGVTMALQSSTATALIVSSFVARELMTLTAALAMMLGADVGTTVAAFLFSIDLVWLPPFLIAVGVFTFLASSIDRTRGIARIAIGLGLTLLALRLIQSASADLQQAPEVTAILGFLEGQPVLAVIAAALVTWLAHSSLSIVILVMSLVVAGVVSLPLALALVIGANVGGAVAPFVDQLGAASEGRRVLLGNLIMRTATAVIAILLLETAYDRLAGLALPSGLTVLMAHVAFNLLVALIFLPLVGPVARLVTILIKSAPPSTDKSEPRYLDLGAIDEPIESLASATRETLALADLVAEMLSHSMEVFEKDDARLLKTIERTDDDVDALHEAIKLYLVKVSAAGLSIDDSRRFVEILTFITHLEHIGDIIDKNLMELAAKKIKNRLAFSHEGLAELRQFHQRVAENMKLACNVFTLRDVRLARKLLGEKALLRDAEVHMATEHFARLRVGRPESIETSAIHLDIIRDLKRINSHLTSVAYPILEAAGELLETRLKQRGEGEVAVAKPI